MHSVLAAYTWRVPQGLVLSLAALAERRCRLSKPPRDNGPLSGDWRPHTKVKPETVFMPDTDLYHAEGAVSSTCVALH
jgi:hypothetical protein